jgi:isoquinoline 1-oxidoreductase beta subunit
MINKTVSRRQFLKSSVIAAGGLSLGFALPGCAPEASREEVAGGSNVSAWLYIDTAGVVTIRVPCSEMGQGVHTSLPMIIAEELDADWLLVRSETAPVTPGFVNPLTGSRGTGGSSAVRRWWPVIANAGATARDMLMRAAAQHWNVAVSELTVENGVVSHSISGHSATFGSLAAAAGALEPAIDVPLKNADQYKIIGTRAKRLDTPSKVNGTALFGIDVQIPEMQYATLAASPNFIGTLVSMDESAAMAVNGVQRIVSLPAAAQESAGVQSIVAMPDAVVVIADSYWQAKKGLKALNPQFDNGGTADISDTTIRAEMLAALGDEDVAVMRDDGDVARASSEAARVISADYTAPFLAHLCMEPMNCTAHYKVAEDNSESLEIWAPTQGESHTLSVLQKVFGLSERQITLHTTLMGGAFGRRYEADFVLQAALISKASAKPVKLLWSREEDVQHDYYRPASASRFEVGIDASGRPVSWKNAVVATSVAKRNFAAALINGNDPFSIEGAVNIPYDIPNQTVTLKEYHSNIPSGSWRSVGSSHNGFYVESMMDEVAVATGKDPFQLRRELLQKHPRFIAVLDRLETESEWQTPAEAGRFRGMAIHECFASIVAEVAEISVSDAGTIKVHKMTCVVDCGQVVNPSIIESQMESAMIDGLTAALWGGVSIKEGRVVQSNFNDYRLMRLGEVPEMYVHIMDNAEAPGGIGEPGVPPSMPALSNALFAATGRRVRSLPLEG